MLRSIIKKSISISLCLIMLFTVFLYPVSAASKLEYTKHVQLLKEGMMKMEMYFEEEGIEVESVLTEYLARLQLELETAKSTDANRIVELVDTCQLLLSDYIDYKSERASVNKDNVSGIRGYDHPVYTPAIALIVTYFAAMGYYLSAILLIHAQENSDINSVYDLSHINYIFTISPVVYRLKYQTPPFGSGSDIFPLDDTMEGNDLYYAIKNFSWSKYQGRLTITDVYDFAPSNEYDGIAGTAVSLMWTAQVLGIIVPFNVTTSI